MDLTLEQVTEMAPDAGSAAAGRKLMALKNWEQVGRSSEALWGMCRGSAVYQVKVDLSNLGYACSCPSRKFPCKHVLGLLMLRAASPEAAPESSEPDWVTDWLSRRRERAEKKSAPVEKDATAATDKKVVDEKAQRRRAQQREARVSDGLERLDVWMKDIVRTGLASVEAKPPPFWEEQAKRLVDAQAGGMAARVSRWSEIPRSGRDWPTRLLLELGLAKLLIQAWQRLDMLDASLQQDVRQLVGWNVTQAELERDGERVVDLWLVAGQRTDDEDRIRVQRSWIVGRATGRWGMVLQFSPHNQSFADAIVPGSEQAGEVVFYPGAARQRAKFLIREQITGVAARPPGVDTIEMFLQQVSDALARLPWLSMFGVMLHDVIVTMRDELWYVRDRDGRCLPIAGRDHWRLLALTGGHPVDVAGEWDGYCLRPLGLYLDGVYRVL